MNEPQEITMDQLQLTRDEWANLGELLTSANFDAAHWKSAQLSASTIAKAQAWVQILDQKAKAPAEPETPTPPIGKLELADAPTPPADEPTPDTPPEAPSEGE